MVGEGKIATTQNRKTCFEDLPSSWNLQVPGDHLEHDAELAYAVGRILEMDSTTLIAGLESYQGSWRRSEVIGETQNGNILMSDTHAPENYFQNLQPHSIVQMNSLSQIFIFLETRQKI